MAGNQAWETSTLDRGDIHESAAVSGDAAVGYGFDDNQGFWDSTQDRNF